MLIKFIIAFLILAASFSTNPEGNMIARLGVETGALIAGVAAMVLAVAIAMRHTGFVIVLLVLVILSNAPEGMAFNINRDYFTAAFLALLVIPMVLRYMD